MLFNTGACKKSCFVSQFISLQFYVLTSLLKWMEYGSKQSYTFFDNRLRAALTQLTKEKETIRVQNDLAY